MQDTKAHLVIIAPVFLFFFINVRINLSFISSLKLIRNHSLYYTRLFVCSI